MDVSVVENIKTLDYGTQILFMILLGVGAKGCAKLKKTDIAECLGIAPQTVGRHLETFVNCKMLKYKYSGLIFINPEFYHVGPAEDKEKLKGQYQAFKSDL